MGLAALCLGSVVLGPLDGCHLLTPSHSSTPARPRHPHFPASRISGIEGSPALTVGWFDGKRWLSHPVNTDGRGR
ncbi:hypothetical protein O3P69_000768 [Scylla paramamosain]|uniref:Secreted protein n=1 Tax=Scylla paramamosain TaxID=85552 RepID=A0AAW0UTX0_SCYPA